MEITGIAAVLGTMSLSVERCMEILKNMIPYLDRKEASDRSDRIRLLIHHVITVVLGVIIAVLSQDLIQPILPDLFKSQGTGEIEWKVCIIIGLLASGGSGLWNSSLRLIQEIKNTRKYVARDLEENLKLKTGRIQGD
jgi:hypothetical protein